MIKKSEYRQHLNTQLKIHLGNKQAWALAGTLSDWIYGNVELLRDDAVVPSVVTEGSAEIDKDDILRELIGIMKKGMSGSDKLKAMAEINKMQAWYDKGDREQDLTVKVISYADAIAEQGEEEASMDG